VPKPGRNGKPRQSIISFISELFAGLAMDHGKSAAKGSAIHFQIKKQIFLGY
jgi:hypothetical protein